MNDTKILVVEDDNGLREALIDTLSIGGYQCLEADSGEAAMLILNDNKVDLVVSDVNMGGMSGISLLRSIKNKHASMPVLLMTAYANISDAVAAMRDGATDYLAKPFSPDDLLNLVSRYAPIRKVKKHSPVVADESSKHLLQLANKVAQTDATVMVLGPSGSGKEVMARYIHDNSLRAEQPFVAINCAAIPENMLEATLFGYEKGAFTGALQACPGKFEQAQNGTILLDEITEMDLSLQAKLLRVLQEREVERIGSRKTLNLNVRVIATSNRDLKEAVREGIFREDLYYRLNVFPLQWLPLAKRKGDILPLAEHLIIRHCQKSGEVIPEMTADAKHKLLQHQWPGNVRELENVVQRALILHSGQVIDVGDLIIEDLGGLFNDSQVQIMPEPAPVTVDVLTVQDKSHTMTMPAQYSTDSPKMLGQEMQQQESQIILDMLIACNGKRKDVAEKLGISPRTLRYKLARMRDAGLEIPA